MSSPNLRVGVGRRGAEFPSSPLERRDSRAFDVVLFGENSLDFVARTCGAPSTVAGKQTLAGFDVFPGGQAATAAVGCARQGLRTQYIGVFGADGWAARVREALARESVDVLAIEVPEAPNRLAVVMVHPSGDRVVHEYRDARLYCRDREPVIAAVRRARIALVDATDLAASIPIARAARAAGVLTIVDVDRVEADTADLLAAIDVLVAPEEFVAAFTGTADLGAGLRAMADEYGSTVAIATRGAGGSLSWAGGREIATPGYQVPVVDTTGAGDAFRAGFCCAWLRHAPPALSAGSPDFDHILRWANATAALNCRALGAQSALPSAEEVAALVTRGTTGRSN